MTLRDIRLSLIQSASALGDYQSMSKLELANGFCQADINDDRELMDAYWSAILLRYFYKIYEWIRNSRSCNLPQEEFFFWLNNSLYDAFYYRSWWWEHEAVVRNGRFVEWKLDENGSKVKNLHYWKIDPDAVDKSINYFCSARRGKEYQALNKQKRKLNVLSYSLDAAQEDTGDSALEKVGAADTPDVSNLVQHLIAKFLKQGRTIEALILDGIAYQNSFKETKSSYYIYNSQINEKTGEEEIVKEKMYNYDSQFDPRKLVKHLNTINQEFMRNYFSIEYDISWDDCESILSKLKSLSNTKLYNYIKKTLENVKQDKDFLSAF